MLYALCEPVTQPSSPAPRPAHSLISQGAAGAPKCNNLVTIAVGFRYLSVTFKPFLSHLLYDIFLLPSQRRCMVSLFKSLQGILSGIFSELPEGVKVVTEFVWRIRWFLLVGWLGWLTFQVVTQVLPYLMWTFIIKSVVGSVFSVLSSL